MLTSSLAGVSSHPSSWCIIWLHPWCLARARRKPSVVLCRCRSAGSFCGRGWHNKEGCNEQKAQGWGADKEIVDKGRVRCSCSIHSLQNSATRDCHPRLDVDYLSM